MTATPITTRRHGEALRGAVFAATLEEITAVGIRRASMDSIAQRAGTGKAALYRRWPNVRALVLDVLVETMEALEPESPSNTGSARDDLLQEMTALAAALGTPIGNLMRALIGEASHDAAFLTELEQRYGVRRYLEVATILERAMLRGDLPRRAIDPYILQIAPALIFHQFVTTGIPPTQAEVAHIVDEIVMPLLQRG